MNISRDTDLHPLVDTSYPDVHTNIKAIVDFFYGVIIKALESYQHANIIGIEKVQDGNDYYLRAIFDGLDDNRFNLDINFIEDGNYHIFVALENTDYDDEEIYSYMIGVRDMAHAIFTSPSEGVLTHKLTPGVYFIIHSDVNSILDTFIRAMQMVEVHMNLVREAEEEEDE